MDDHDLQRQLEVYYTKQSPAIRVGEPSRLLGGYDTDIFRFTLTDDNGAYERVLRRYPASQPDVKPVFEAVVQNQVGDLGFPVPRVFDVCTDRSVLGRAFIVMEFAEGRTLLHAPEAVQSRLLGRTHAELHGLDANGVHDALAKVDPGRFGLARRLDMLEIESRGHPRVRDAVSWIVANQPIEDAGRHSVCHGDFHKLNVICDDAASVTAVLDWSGVAIADPEFDVAQTVLIFGTQVKYLTDEFAPIDSERVVADYLAGYREQGAVDPELLAFYSVVRATMAIVKALDGHQLWKHPDLLDELEKFVAERIG